MKINGLFRKRRRLTGQTQGCQAYDIVCPRNGLTPENETASFIAYNCAHEYFKTSPVDLLAGFKPAIISVIVVNIYYVAVLAPI